MIIGISGPAGAGKDTIADWIVQSTGQFRKVSFAAPIKAMLSVGLGLTHQQLYGNLKEVIEERYGKTPRDMMQTLGTEWGRRLVADDIWVQALLQDENIGNVVIADVRFDNEAKLIRKKGGFIIGITGRKNEDVPDHASETGVTLAARDMIINNSSDLCDLIDVCNPILERIHQEFEHATVS